MSMAEKILSALGGNDNIVELEPCITRLRVEVVDPKKVEEDKLTEAGAYGVVTVSNSVQIVMGPIADNIAEDIEAIR